MKHLVDLVIQIVSNVSAGSSCESNLMSTVIDVLQGCRNVGIGKDFASGSHGVRCGCSRVAGLNECRFGAVGRGIHHSIGDSSAVFVEAIGGLAERDKKGIGTIECPVRAGRQDRNFLVPELALRCGSQTRFFCREACFNDEMVDVVAHNMYLLLGINDEVLGGRIRGFQADGCLASFKARQTEAYTKECKRYCKDSNLHKGEKPRRKLRLPTGSQCSFLETRTKVSHYAPATAGGGGVGVLLPLAFRASISAPLVPANRPQSFVLKSANAG